MGASVAGSPYPKPRMSCALSQNRKGSALRLSVHGRRPTLKETFHLCSKHNVWRAL
jgi:hypothetical protein